MRIVFLISALSLITIVNSSAVAAATSFKIHINKTATVEIPIAATEFNKNPKENYFYGLKGCTKTSFLGANVNHTIQCLEFHTAFANEKWVQVPVSVVDLSNEEDFAANLAKLGTSAQKEKKQNFDWGFVSSWVATQNSAHYFYLIPKDRTYGLRIGPIAATILKNYNLQFQRTIWKFND